MPPIKELDAVEYLEINARIKVVAFDGENIRHISNRKVEDIENPDSEILDIIQEVEFDGDRIIESDVDVYGVFFDESKEYLYSRKFFGNI